jgi:hypothetical protein
LPAEVSRAVRSSTTRGSRRCKLPPIVNKRIELLLITEFLFLDLPLDYQGVQTVAPVGGVVSTSTVSH